MTKIRGRVAGVDAADLTGITVKIWRSSNRAGGFLHPSSVDSTGAFEIHLRDGTVSTRLRGNLWKGPFHVSRM